MDSNRELQGRTGRVIISISKGVLQIVQLYAIISKKRKGERKMKTSTKILSVLLALIMVLSCMPFAFAAEEAEPAETQASGLKAEVLFDKEQYGLLDTAVMTVKLTNESDKVLNIKQVYVLTLDFSPKGFIDYNNLDFLKSGETDSFSCNISLSSSASGLNFFARILLFFKQLFTGKSIINLNQATNDADPFNYKEVFYADYGKYGKREINVWVHYEALDCDEAHIAEAVELYNNAAQAGTDGTGNITMSLVDGSLKAEGRVASLLPTLESAMKSALEKNSYTFTEVPGNPPLNYDDVLAASVKSENGKTSVFLLLKDQTDGFNADPKNGGAVSRGIGTLGSIASALDEMGATIQSGEDTISLKYTDATIGVVIDDETGKIISGSWNYRVLISVEDAEFKMGISASIKGLEAAIDYRAVL